MLRKISIIAVRKHSVNLCTIGSKTTNEIESNFYGERNTGSRAITAASYKQPKKLSQLQNTQLNLLTVTFLAILKQTDINLH